MKVKEGAGTDLVRLWTPILTGEIVNARTKVFVKVGLGDLCRVLDLIVCAVSFDDRRKKDIQVLCLCLNMKGGRIKRIMYSDKYG